MCGMLSDKDSLEEEISARRKEIHTEGYPMSIGEIINLYENDEIDIHPEFQRFFRWSDLQKTKLVESILLGIPIPSIFISQRDDGVWDVIDGVQRLSTILQFVGNLKNEEGKKEMPLKLLKTEYLPSLEGKYWETKTPKTSLTLSQRLTFKREKLDLKIITKESDKDYKFELFQRLNSLGSALSAQELRNSLMIMLDRTFYDWIKDLSKFPHFQEAVQLTERDIMEAYDMELVLRFLGALNSKNFSSIKDLDYFITNKMKTFIEDPKFNRKKQEEIFKNTFEILDKAIPEGSFRRFDVEKGRYAGKFLISVFEVLTGGIGKNVENWYPPNDSKLKEIDSIARNLWSNNTFLKNQGTGTNISSRLSRLTSLGELLFSKR